jgi:hypothetical protein
MLQALSYYVRYDMQLNQAESHDKRVRGKVYKVVDKRLSGTRQAVVESDFHHTPPPRRLL